MRRAVIIDAVRSPFARARTEGAYAGLHPVDLYAQVIKALIARTGIDPEQVEDIISGCVLQVGEQSGNISRTAGLAAGLPTSVPGVTVDRKCGSAQQAMDFAAQGIIAGAYDIVIAGGVEMMSLVPMRLNRLDRDSEGPLFRQRYPEGLVRQGISAELIAGRWHLPRERLDRFALMSHQKAATAQSTGLLAKDIVPIAVKRGDAEEVVSQDDGIRRDTTIQRLAALKPAFVEEDAARRWPEISWRITAGNSSQVSDGASAILLAEESVAAKLGLKPRAAITHFAICGDDPLLMLTAIIPATRKLLQRAGRSVDDIDVFEVNEAFASVVLAWSDSLHAEESRINPLGGAIAFGHPVGASGGRLLTSLLRGLEQRNGRFGLLTMCESGGMANATLIERL